MKAHPGLITSDKQPLLATGLAAEKQLSDTRAWLAEQMSDSQFVSSDETSLGNIEHQMGQTLDNPQFEAKLRKLSPHYPMRFENHPTLVDKRVWYIPIPEHHQFSRPEKTSNGDWYVVYERADENVGRMPEFSIMFVKEEWVPDPNFRHFNVGDMPKTEWDPIEKKLIYHGKEDRPGFKKVKRPWSEARRGWRTPLIRAVEAGFYTPTEIERVFGRANRAAWANHMGYQNVPTLGVSS